jgi:uncharacterized protein
MVMLAILEQHKDQLIELCRRYHVAELEVFGLAVTDEFNEASSDLDFLVVFDESVSKDRFDAFFGLHEELENLFARPVDLIEPEGLRNPYFIQTINQTRRRLYAAT